MTAASGVGSLAVEGPRRFTLAIDPGPVESGFAVLSDEDRHPFAFGKIANDALLAYVRRVVEDDDFIDDDEVGPGSIGRVAIEMIASYGMAVGAEVFETCVWIGRFEQTVRDADVVPARVPRKPIKRHFCGTDQAKDSNIRQALVDRFAYGVPNYGKGRKAEPGWFYGFSADVWSAYALGVYAVDEGIS